MAKKSSLASMSVDALFKLRDEVAAAISVRASALQKQLAQLTGSEPARRRGRPPGKKGGKVAVKYRGPNGESWTGRGLKPRWLTAELQKGKTIESFAVGKAPRKKK